MESGQELVLDANSPVTKYEVMLLEKSRERPSEDGTVLVFCLLDELIPHLGVYTRLIKLARDELFDAVYSTQYTGQLDKNKQYIQRVPFFTLMSRVHQERNEESDALRDQLDEVKQRLFEKHQQLGAVEGQVDSLQCEVKELQSHIAELDEELVDKNAEIDRLEDILESSRTEVDRMKEQLEGDISDLNDALQESQDEVAYLSQFKQGFDNLQKAFIEHAQKKDITVPHQQQKTVIANPKTHLVGNIESSQQLEKQLLNVQNALIEEFDLFMESHKSTLQTLPVDSSKLTDENYNELDQSAQEMIITVQRFLQRIEELNTELGLIDQHRIMLQEQLQDISGESIQSSSPDKESKGRSLSRPKTQELVLSAGLDHEDPDKGKKNDPFIANEQVFSKYAAMLYTSDNGGTFHEFTSAKYCASCGEKTVLCPHKIGNREQVFALPPMTTHIKIKRPKVTINYDIQKTNSQREEKEAKKRPLPSTLSQSNLFSAPELTVASLSAVWDDYKMRTSVQRSIQRPLSLDRTLAMMEEFSAVLLWHDEAMSEQAAAQSVLDELYAWLNDRYQHADVAFLVAHDLLTGVVEHAPSNKVVQILGHILTSDLDASAWRYLMLMTDFIQLVNWVAVEDFRAFAHVIYPFLTEDDIENLQMGYTSFSENKMSPLLVCEYIIYLIFKGREPLFSEFEGRLLSFPGCDQNDLSEQEFLNAADSIIAVLDHRLCKRLYRSAAAGNQGSENGRVQMARLGHILAYMGLLQLAPVIRDTVDQKVTAARQNMGSENLRGRVVPVQDKIISMESVKTLATNLARCQESQRLFETGDEDLPDRQYLSYTE